MNKKLKKSQVLMLSLLTILLIIVPLLSSSQRPTYIYFITNLLIIALGAEAGLLSSFFSKPINTNLDDRKNTTFSEDDEKVKKFMRVVANGSEEKVGPNDHKVNNIINVEKSLSEKKIIVDNGSLEGEKVKKCPSMPSLFFIGGGDNEGDFDEAHYEDHEEEVEEISGQELFAKAETFIGDFYKQLKMQREESWKRIHGFYQRAF
ncbi:hypothetical protein L484_000203 [Morus notabilis]|uniref:DUF4408 domain-containing protein n=1 Tax=Morus notabilis TaxID=981085 RepID=W9RP82_9ROSA|nr:hypothetical protein L484_012472 [Morus notabilis]EXC36079.1 hypothetical protein L484_000203 [Morus notabilis]